MSGMGAKPEAADADIELPLSAASSHQADVTRDEAASLRPPTDEVTSWSDATKARWHALHWAVASGHETT
jgi:hypothetical protein